MPRPALVGHKVRRLRRQNGLTQVEMAAKLGISPSYLNLIEHNQRALTRALLLKMGELFGIDLQSFSGNEEARLLSDLTEVFGDSLFGEHALGRDELNELVGAAPGIAHAILSLYRAYRSAREEALGLSERLSDNPFLEASSHRLLTLLTSIRSFSEILRDNVDLSAIRRQQYIGTVVEESEKLTDLVNELFDFICGHGQGKLRAVDSPSEEVVDYLHAQGNHFPEFETAAEAVWGELRLNGANAFEALAARLEREHGVAVRIVPCGREPESLRRYDPERRCLFLSEVLAPSSRSFQAARQLGLLSCAAEIEARLAAAELSTPAAQAMVREALGNYFAGALLMPYDAFFEAARELRHDLELLQQRFGASFEQVCHRLTTLQRPDAEGVPFHFLRLDIAGNIVKWFSASGLRIPRFGGACPRWNVHSAFMNPGRIDAQLARLTDGSTYLFVSRAGTKRGAGYRAPRTYYSVSIGCEVSFADRLVYADGLGVRDAEAAVPVGVHCRLCERADCRQRAFPSLLH
ncbi:MAG: short-chain fatty acyl-CoA regulator family protein [Kiloniellaceae bacterium]